MHVAAEMLVDGAANSTASASRLPALLHHRNSVTTCDVCMTYEYCNVESHETNSRNWDDAENHALAKHRAALRSHAAEELLLASFYGPVGRSDPLRQAAAHKQLGQ